MAWFVQCSYCTKHEKHKQLPLSLSTILVDFKAAVSDRCGTHDSDSSRANVLCHLWHVWEPYTTKNKKKPAANPFAVIYLQRGWLGIWQRVGWPHLRTTRCEWPGSDHTWFIFIVRHHRTLDPRSSEEEQILIMGARVNQIYSKLYLCWDILAISSGCLPNAIHCLLVDWSEAS